MYEFFHIADHFPILSGENFLLANVVCVVSGWEFNLCLGLAIVCNQDVRLDVSGDAEATEHGVVCALNDEPCYLAAQVFLNSVNFSCEAPNDGDDGLELILCNLHVIPQSSYVVFKLLHSGLEVFELCLCFLETLVEASFCLLEFFEALDDRCEAFSLFAELAESFLNPLYVCLVLLNDVFNGLRVCADFLQELCLQLLDLSSELCLCCCEVCCANLLAVLNLLLKSCEGCAHLVVLVAQILNVGLESRDGFCVGAYLLSKF